MDADFSYAHRGSATESGGVSIIPQFIFNIFTPPEPVPEPPVNSLVF